MSRALHTGSLSLPARELPAWLAGLLTIGSTALAIFAGINLATGLLAVAAFVAAQALMELV